MNLNPIILAGALTAALSLPAFAAEKSYDIGAFSRVSVSAGISAEISVGGAPAARAEGTDEGVERLEVVVEGDELVLRRKPRMGFNWGKNQRVKVFVTAPELAALDVSSGASTTASGVDAPEFSIDASSGSSTSVSGKCGAIAIDASSGASLNASGLVCETARIDASSGASVKAHATNSVSADASSGASIRVSGAPGMVDIDKSSGGSVSVGQ